MTKLNWNGFSKKSITERLELLQKNNLLSPDSLSILANQEQLPLETANQMAENVLGELSLPFAIAPDFLVDGQNYHLPMVTEEPSVVAAASFAAKIIKRSGGFQTKVEQRRMIGQVALYQVPDMEKASQAITNQSSLLLSKANAAHPSIVKRGGGVI